MHTHPHVPNRQNHLQAALTEAAFLTGVEHNADHVVMTCYAPLFAQKIYQLAEEMPIITGGALQSGKKCYTVLIDEAQGMELILEHLLSLGHRKIAQIGGTSLVISTWAKMEQFNRVMARHGIEPNPNLVVDEVGYSYETGYQQTNALLERGERPTAIIAINDASALGVLQSLREHQLRVPEDVSVVGYDNTIFSTIATPMLTTVDYDYDLLGKKLVETAISAVHGETVDKIQFIQPSLVVRGSTAPVRRE